MPILTKYALRTIYHSDTLDSEFEFEAELLSFPESAHDDQVDALVYSVGGLDREIRQAWPTGDVSGMNWSPLPHEKRRRTWVYDIQGNPHLLGGDDDDDPAADDTQSATNVPSETSDVAAPKVPVPDLTPAFSERFIGDDLVVTARDGTELMRIARGQSHLYFWQKRTGTLPWLGANT